MNLITLIEPAEEPVTLAQVYAHLRLTPDPIGSPAEQLTHPDDAMLLTQIATARKDCENTARRAFVRQKLRMVTGPEDRFHWPWLQRWTGSYSRCRGIELLRPPLLEIVEVSYFDPDNVLQVVAPSDYYVSEEDPARLSFGSSFAVPAVYGRSDALRIDYWAGYPAADSPQTDWVSRVPAPLKSAVLLGVELQYEALAPNQREQLEKAQANFLTPYTVMIAV